MARLKTHTKVLLVIAISAVTCAGVWNLGLRDLLTGGDDDDAPAAATDGTTAPAAATGHGAFGTAENPLKVSIVSWHGYAPALVANGASLETQAGSIFDQAGVRVRFLLQDDLPTLTANFVPGTAQCSWRTIDFFAQEQPQVRQNGRDAKIVMIVDNSRGSDAIVAHRDVNSVEDMAGHSVGLTQYTPSHMVLTHALEQSLLTERKRASVGLKFLPSVPEVRAAFESGQVDVAVLWEPDTTLALENTKDSHVVYSTATATNLIYDVIVCDSAVINAYPDVIQRFVTGWLQGVDVAEKDRAAATRALAATEPMFDELVKSKGAGFMDKLYQGVKWTGLADNIRVLGLGGETSSGEAIYAQADRIWRENTELIAKETPVIPPVEAFDLRFVKALADADAAAREAAKKPEFTFTDAERKQAVAAKPELTKPVSVNFPTGSAELSKRALKMIDTDIVPLLDNMGGAYFSVEGNTDSTGMPARNNALSLQRAQAVVDYLVSQWEFPRERFKVAGNGSTKPRCNEGDLKAEGTDLETCQATNRRTDVAVFGR